MADRAADCRIAASAWRRWEDQPVPMPLDEALDAFFALPAAERPEARVVRPPLVWNWATGVVDGWKLVVRGHKNGAGQWAVIASVESVGRRRVD